MGADFFVATKEWFFEVRWVEELWHVKMTVSSDIRNVILPDISHPP